LFDAVRLESRLLDVRVERNDLDAERAGTVGTLAADAPQNFLMIVPEKVQADPNISTE